MQHCVISYLQRDSILIKNQRTIIGDSDNTNNGEVIFGKIIIRQFFTDMQSAILYFFLYLCNKLFIVDDKVKYWIELSDYDFETAEAMFTSKRFLYVGFMCHQTIEKAFKAYFTLIKSDVTPFLTAYHI